MPGSSRSSRVLTSDYGGSVGEAIAVQAVQYTTVIVLGVPRVIAQGTAIQVLGAPGATVDGIPGGGAVHLWVGGQFAQRLTGEPTYRDIEFWQEANGSFGSSVDVGNGVVVVGAPYEDGAPLAGGFRSTSSWLSGFGAAYVFERDSEGEWRRVAKLTVGENPAFTDPAGQSAPSQFGANVAISDDGATIVVSQIPAPTTGADHNWGASAHVFTKPASGWTDMNTNHANVTSLRYDSNGATADDATVVDARWEAYGDVDIAGDGSVVAVGGSQLPRTSDFGDQTGAVLVFNRPGTAWTDGSDRLLEQDAVLTATDHERNNVQVGSDIAINRAGEVIAANGAAPFIFINDDARDPVSGWPGSVFVWVRGGSWSDTNSATATLSDSLFPNGAQFGADVAISDSGDRVVAYGGSWSNVSNHRATNVFDKPGGGWADASTPTVRLSSWPWSSSRRVALDGESTLLNGIPGSGGYLGDLGDTASWTGLVPDCSASSSDDIVTQTCILRFEQGRTHTTTPAITVPDGASDGEFVISASATVNGVAYTDALTVSVREVDEVAQVALDFATRHDAAADAPYPSSIAPGETTRLRLSVLNDNGEASGPDSADGVASILFTTTAGAFSRGAFAPVWLIESFRPPVVLYRAANCEGGNGQQTCSVDLTNLNAANADRIVIFLAHPGADKAGTAEVRATVITNDGESFTPPPLSVTFTGEAASLAISEPTGSLFRAATDADDDRDTLKLIVSAADAAGNDVEIPYRAPHAVVRDPDGKVVTSGVSVVWTEDGNDADNAHDRFVRNTADAVEATVRVTAAAAEPLETGVYTLELRTAGKSATREFTVVGEADSVALSEPEGELRVGGTVSFTATLRDAEGNPAPDGTRVSWAERSTSQTAVLVLLTADRATTGGAATATFLAVNFGSAVVSAESGEAREVALLSIAAPPSATAAEQAASPHESLSNQGAPGIDTWQGESEIKASALLDALSGISSIQLWVINRWFRYAVADGQAIPGSSDFAIQPGAVLWLSP